MQKVWFYSFLIWFNLSCWYSFTEKEKTGKSLYIKPFTNLTAEPGLSQNLVRAITDELSSIFNFKPEQLADYSLEGTITNISENPFTYTAQETPKEIKITIRCKIQLLVRKTNSKIENELEGWGTYLVSDGNRQDGIDKAIKLLKEKICDIVRTLP